MPDTTERTVPLLSRLHAPVGSVRGRMRIGRGTGSGKGKTGGQGQKGQKARGTMKKLHFQGGQIPLQRALPKVGFNNIFATRYAPVNLADFGGLPVDALVDEEVLRGFGLVRGKWDGVKVLGAGEVDRAFKVRVHAISGSARAKIEAAGGSVELVVHRSGVLGS